MPSTLAISFLEYLRPYFLFFLYFLDCLRSSLKKIKISINKNLNKQIFDIEFTAALKMSNALRLIALLLVGDRPRSIPEGCTRPFLQEERQETDLLCV